jgi:hypothetical protein
MDCIDNCVEFLAKVLSNFLTGTEVEGLIRTIEPTVTAYELTQLYISALQSVASSKTAKAVFM